MMDAIPGEIRDQLQRMDDEEFRSLLEEATDGMEVDTEPMNEENVEQEVRRRKVARRQKQVNIEEVRKFLRRRQAR